MSSPGRQLDSILDYVEQRRPSGARKKQDRLNEIFRLLADHPMAGETTSRSGVRRMVKSPYPYIIFYRVKGSDVIIQRIRHAARRPI